MKGTFLAAVMLVLAGCGGNIGKLPSDDPHYSFDAQLLMTPMMPTVGARIDLNLDVTSVSNRDVKTDVVLRVVGADGRVMYQNVWNAVQFNQGEDWNLTQGFYPDSDAGNQKWTIELLVRNHADSSVLFDESIADLNFNKS